MTLISSEAALEADAPIAERRQRPAWIQRVREFRPGPLHASAIVSCVVAYKSFEMSYAALHNLAIRNLVPPELAANVPIVTDGLMVGSIIATASFRKGGLGWWYATVLFVLSTLLSVAGNIEYAREIGGGYVSVGIYAGMPMTMMFAVHLTLMLWSRRRERHPQRAIAESEPVRPVEAEAKSAPPPEEFSVPDMFDMSDLPTEPERRPVSGPFIAPELTEPNRFAPLVEHRPLVHLGERTG
ncbi:DUF2637 domain-containing protein [Nocardia sp. CDC159]|uniref:DUF2637 domain-containing protein n=1 Tax=Nocardia pulmonis TaxID=2951408 RepID=A0A9X2EBY3_9NOCA|nr:MULTISPECIES: DUF2637 domain-containing protein [Nocardia]MCM6777531.1 DUF2637 domain-containing protein [Nocardia pulmonis]MCM6790362.1 DUF2637 domain-containing protein [Nocardia sp. CDC159]